MNDDSQVESNDVRPGGGTDPGPKGDKSYPALGGPTPQSDDSQGSGGGTDPGPKGTQSYPGYGK